MTRALFTGWTWPSPNVMWGPGPLREDPEGVTANHGVTAHHRNDRLNIPAGVWLIQWEHDAVLNEPAARDFSDIRDSDGFTIGSVERSGMRNDKVRVTAAAQGPQEIQFRFHTTQGNARLNSRISVTLVEPTEREAMTETVTIETFPNGYDAYMIDGESYPVRDEDTVEEFMKYSRHYALLAKHLDSPEQKERRRLKARRAEIAKRYGMTMYAASPTTRAMIEDILKLEEAVK